MTSMLRSFAKRFIKDDRGSMTIEFVLQFTIFFALFVAAAELGLINTRHAVLERAVDETVRDIRIGTGTSAEYADIRSNLCDALGIDENCNENLLIEMQPVQPRDFVAPQTAMECRNVSAEANPANEFTHGSENELMLLRVCLRYKPLFPTTGIASSFTIDANGYAQLVSKSVFVQEPR